MAKKTGARKPARVAAATGAATAKRRDVAAGIEAAMAAAVAQANRDGISDPAEVRERMLAARETVKARD